MTLPKKDDVRRARQPKARAGKTSEKATTDKPHYDADTRTLWFRAVIVKHFAVPAKNQIGILEAFEEDGWSPWIDDPIPPRAGIKSEDVLHDAINGLNDSQVHALLQFHGDGTGTRVGWTVRTK